MRVYRELEVQDIDTTAIPEPCLDVLLHKQRSAQWGAFFHGLIHNVNGPLQNMTMLVEMLENSQAEMDQAILQETGEDDPRVKEVSERHRKRLRQLSQQIHILGETLQDFIAVDDIEQNGGEVDLRMLLPRLVRVFRADLFFKHNVALDLQIDDDIPPLKIPGSVVVPALIHLLDNALAALRDSREKSLRIRCHREDGDVVLVFSDTGCGLSVQSDPKNLCTPFECRRPAQYGRSGKRHKHFGLGLYLTCLMLKPYGVQLALAYDGKETSAILRMPVSP